MEPNSIEIPVADSIDAKVQIPGSKSITNRALLIAALANGNSTLKSVLHSNDTHYMIEAWKNLGVNIELRPENVVVVNGCAGKIREYSEPIYVENAGTAARFLTAALTIGKGTYIITGNKRMQERPIADLMSALRQIGATVKDINSTSCPPIKIEACGLDGGLVEIAGEKSSQYISAVMLAAPFARNDTKIKITGKLVSKTYVEMTTRMMREFGAEIEWVAENEIIIKAGRFYQGCEYQVEPDASSASYFWGMAAITGGVIEISDFQQTSTQGDLGLVDILEKMGCQVIRTEKSIRLIGNNSLEGIDVDMNTMSDVAPTLAVIALFANGKTTIRNVANMRIKECDRISAVCNELKKLGAQVTEFEDGLEIVGKSASTGAEIHTYDDHRMAMAFSLAGLKIPGVRILDPGCVSKTFPTYFDLMFSILSRSEK